MRRKVLATPPLDEALVVLVMTGLFLAKSKRCDVIDCVDEDGGDM